MGSSTAGYGVSLYSTGPLEGNLPSHGISFSGTSRFGTHGSVVNGWATYFTSSTDQNRGWIWKLFDTNSITSGNIASLSGYGNLTITNSTTSGPTNAVLNLTKSTTPTEQNKWYYHSTFFIPNTTTGTNFLLLMGKSAESLNSGGINYYYTGVDSSTNNFVSLCLYSGANNILKAYGNKNVDIAGKFLPQTTDTQDIGSNTLKWNTAHLNNLQLYNNSTTTTLSKGENLLTLSANNTTYYTFREGSFGPTSDQVSSNISLGTSYYKWNNLYLKDSVYIYNTTDTSRYIRLQNINSSGSYQVKIPNYSGHMWLAHVGGASAVGSSTQPVYVDENGRLTAITGALTNGSAYLTNYNHYSNSATQTINLNNDEVAVGAMFHFTVKANVTGSPGVDSTILQMNWANNGGYNSQFGIPTSDNRAFFRRQSAGTWQDWQEIAHGPLNTQVGSSTQPVYLSNTGTITQGTQYAGGTNITLNGVSQGGSIANIYAPTTGATAGYVLQANGSGTNAPTWKPGIYYGTCTATGATKTVNIQDFPSTLVEGQIIYVKFTAAGTTSNITLNVSNTGAKPVYFSSNIATANNYGRYWYANDIVCFVYNKLSENEDCWLVLNAYSYDSYRTRMLYTTAAATATNKHYILGTRTTSSNTAAAVYRAYASNNSSANTSGIYFTGSEGVLYGAAWNDYAEFRHSENSIEAGRVVKELGNGTLELVNERLARGCEIVSDTYGFAIGETDYCQLPTAASGRVLAYPDRDPSTFEIGAPVCSGPNGTVSQMTEEEERLYPSRIIGTVSEIPTYEIWHGGKDVEVNGRIWIRIR